MSLHSSKRQNRDLVYGVNAVMAALETAPEKILSAWVARDREDDRRIHTIIQELQSYGVKVQPALRHFLDEKAEGGVHQGVIIEMTATPPKGERELEEMVEAGGDLLFLVLDAVSDPRNLGAAMRSAWAAGAAAVIVPRDKSAPLTPAARKAASGAGEALPLIAVTNLARTLDYLRDHEIKIVGLAGESAENLYTLDLKGPLALVMGAEDKGMRRLTREKCDVCAKIPMAQGVESLNVAVAAGVALFEARRQRLQ